MKSPQTHAGSCRRAASGGNETSSPVFAGCFIPGLSSCLDRIPRAGERRGIAQVEVIQFQLISNSLDRSNLNLIPDVDAMSLQLGFYQLSEDCINRHQNRFRPAREGNVYPAMGQGIRHLEADISGAHDDGRFGLSLFQKAMNSKAVIHCVKGKDPRQMEAFDYRLYGPGAGADQ